MRASLSIAAAVLGAGLLLSGSAWSHNFLTKTEAYAGHRVDIELLVTHGCRGAPVKEVRVKIPEEINSVRPHHDHDWEIRTKMRPLAAPITGEGGITITEVVDEIVWTSPKKAMPDNMYESFRMRALMPDEPGKILFFRSINVCEEGDDPYIDLPEDALSLQDEDFTEKLWKFMTATSTPAPFLILRQAPKKQYPWEWTPEQVRGEEAVLSN